MTNENNVDVMYFHGETVEGNRFTIAGVIENDDMILGIALCADGDQFNKVKGRTIATNRALNQRKFPSGKLIISLYSHDLVNEFKGEAGFPENYFKGNEIKIFRDMVFHYNFFKKEELMREFGLFNRVSKSHREIRQEKLATKLLKMIGKQK